MYLIRDPTTGSRVLKPGLSLKKPGAGLCRAEGVCLEFSHDIFTRSLFPESEVLDQSDGGVAAAAAAGAAAAATVCFGFVGIGLVWFSRQGFTGWTRFIKPSWSRTQRSS